MFTNMEELFGISLHPARGLRACFMAVISYPLEAHIWDGGIRLRRRYMKR